MFNVLFVCTENTCRSPMAKYILKQTLEKLNIKNIKVDSCGICVTDRSHLSINARKVLKELNINVRHKAKQITRELIEKNDLVLTMTMGHKMSILMKFGIVDNLFTFSEYVNGVDISDPYGGSLDVYKNCANKIYSNCLGLIEKLRKNGVINV